ncbi:MAG: iron-containing alcohol dehydrogenase, partial [Clostridia bacterium]|nr:iron-containing alcohol dehydrogenase [Clostridia bacterium]
MENYTHDIPTKILFGKGQIVHLPEILAGYGRRVLLCYGGGSIKKTGLYDEIMTLLKDFTVIECGGIEPNPRISSVERGAKLCREHNVDVILAAGGGSVIDCAKAIAVGTFYEGDLWEMVLTAREGRKALPLVDILTLSATGSEYDGGGVITNPETNEKLGGSYTYPAVSICDPTYTFTVSPYQTAAGSADIMSHVMEGYVAETTDSILSDGIAEALL